MDEDAREMPAPRVAEAVELVVGGEGQALERAVEIRRRGIEEKEMAEALRDEPPTADQRIAQHERGVVPDKTIAQRGPVNEKRRRYDDNDGNGTRELFQGGDDEKQNPRQQARRLASRSSRWCWPRALSPASSTGVKQLIVSIAPTWDSSDGRLQLFERKGGGWKRSGPAWPVLYGKNGLVWGRGVLGTGEPGTHKQERDGRAPCGVFRIGTIYTYDAALPAGAKYPFHTVTAGDAWVDDVTSPDYNRHVTVDPANPPPWFEKQKMRHSDFAYRWLVEIRHNSDPPVPGAGSAIFFHIRRGPTVRPPAAPRWPRKIS